MDISRDPRLGPLNDLRKEYLANPMIKKELDCMIYTPSNSSYSSPLKTPSKFINDIAFNSPLPLKASGKLKYGAQMLQDTPVRKVQFGKVSSIVNDCSLPANVDYERDPVFAKIIHSESLKNAVQNAAQSSRKPLPVNIGLPTTIPDIVNADLTKSAKEKLHAMGINHKDMLQSAVLNAPFYERLFKNLNDMNINYATCQQLRPLEILSKELRTDRPLYEEVREYVTTLPKSLEIAYAPINMNLQQAMSISRSTDSGFDSKPSTPSHSAAGYPLNYSDDVNALAGRFAAVPGIQDMNMYPTVAPSKESSLPTMNMQNLSLLESGDKQGNIFTLFSFFDYDKYVYILYLRVWNLAKIFKLSRLQQTY